MKPSERINQIYREVITNASKEWSEPVDGQRAMNYAILKYLDERAEEDNPKEYSK